MRAWPMDTSAVHGMFLMKYSRLSALPCSLGCIDEWSHCRGRILWEELCIWLCIQLDPVASAKGGCFSHFRYCIDEDGCPDAMLVEFLADFCEEIFVADSIPSCIGCYRILCIRYQCYLMRAHLAHQVDE